MNNIIEEPMALCLECGQRVFTDDGGNILPHDRIVGIPCEKKEMNLTEFHNYMKSMLDNFIVVWLGNNHPKVLELPEWMDQWMMYIDMEQQEDL